MHPISPQISLGRIEIRHAHSVGLFYMFWAEGGKANFSKNLHGSCSTSEHPVREMHHGSKYTNRSKLTKIFIIINISLISSELTLNRSTLFSLTTSETLKC